MNGVRVVNGSAMVDSDREDDLPTAGKKRNALLTIADVQDIRARHAEWKRMRAEWMKFNAENNRNALAKQYGLTKRYLDKVVGRSVWKTVDQRFLGGRGTPMRGLCKWGEMALNEYLLFPCPLNERKRVAQLIRRAAWAWCDRNDKTRKFGVTNAVGGLIVRRVA